MKSFLKITIASFSLFFLFGNHVSAREWLGPKSNETHNSVKSKAAGCSPALTLSEFYVNNVRTAAETGGNTWFDRPNSNPYYEVPALERNHAIFAGALWMGGRDFAGNLKLAAVRFRSNGSDYWPGPLSIDGFASTIPETCAKWDRFFLMSRQMVERHRYFFTLVNQGIDPATDPLFVDGYVIPRQIMDWPAHGDISLNQSPIIAPFADFRDPVTQEIIGTPGVYEPDQGDYPLYDLDQEIDCRTRLVTDPVPLFGDFTMYWVFNDNGNIHTESLGQPIGMEIQGQMFGFTTNDEVNNMTFCNYVLINRGSLTLSETYFAQWTDTDLGNPFDDYVGCDVGRGLAYCYNGTDFDDTSQSGPGYGSQPPAIGVDFFEGPYQDADGINNLVGIGPNQALNGLGYLDESLPEDSPFRDTIIDNERFGMRRFVYHSNFGQGPAPTTDPSIASEYYNMMRGIWKNNTPMTVGGLGFNPNDPNAIRTDFMFPGLSDPLFWGTNGIDPNFPDPAGWTEETAGNPPGDRRFIQAAGPFTLSPGQFNNITVGVVYARAPTGGPFASVRALLGIDDKAQALFENCFRLLDGPDAPELTAQELDKEIILYLRNTNPISNNIREEYTELDPTIPPFDIDGNPFDQFYRFQGYKVYQLRGSEVSVSDIEKPESARLVFQCDIKDGVTQLINYDFDESIGLPVPREMVNGANTGIRHSIRITNDQFATGDTRLVNFKRYYFLAIAYGFNEFEPYNPDPNRLSGQPRTYIRSRKSATGEITPLVVIPNKPNPREFGTIQNAQFGDGLPITRIEGQGNGNRPLALDNESVLKIIEGPVYKADSITYTPGNGPIDVKIVDPLNVRLADFELRFYSDERFPNGNYSGSIDDARWFLVDLSNPSDTIVFSEQSITRANEQIIPEYGISVSIGQSFIDLVDPESDDNTNRSLDYVSASLTYPSGPSGWLSGVADAEGSNLSNWIRSGRVNEDATTARDGSGAVIGLANSGAPCFTLSNGIIDNFFFNDYQCGAPSESGSNIGSSVCTPLDPFQQFEGILGGIIAPVRLASAYDCGVAPLSRFALNIFNNNIFPVDLTTLPSVQLSFTPDKSKWTRCAVLETNDNPTFSQGNAAKMTRRVTLSVDKNGRNQFDPGVNMDEATYFGQQVLTQAVVDAFTPTVRQNLVNGLRQTFPQIASAADLVGLSIGMGWFPGYAIDTGTGERLNLMFGENSFLTADNGRDMLWNPSSRQENPFGQRPIWGGEHYIYILGNSAREYDLLDRVPLYDGSQYVYDGFNAPSPAQPAYLNVYRALRWVMVPLLGGEAEWASPEQGLVPGEATIRVTVGTPYGRYPTLVEELGPASVPFVDPNTNLELSSNQWWPVYRFNTSGLATVTNDDATATSALDLIDIVPNPYYAYSAYEVSRVDNRVRFVNLPPECKIQIFTINGTLIRILEKDNSLSWLDWDLQNETFIPIAGGMYLIHVQVPGVGERVLKFFCATRPTDLRNF